jgi:hypothetical protein
MRGNRHMRPLVIHIQLNGLNVNMYWASKTLEFKLLTSVSWGFQGMSLFYKSATNNQLTFWTASTQLLPLPSRPEGW